MSHTCSSQKFSSYFSYKKEKLPQLVFALKSKSYLFSSKCLTLIFWYLVETTRFIFRPFYSTMFFHLIIYWFFGHYFKVHLKNFVLSLISSISHDLRFHFFPYNSAIAVQPTIAFHSYFRHLPKWIQSSTGALQSILSTVISGIAFTCNLNENILSY